MKILVFSDTHLTKRFDKKKYDFLFSIINSVDQVIINGDFWDSWFTDFDSFIHSEWRRLFPILKKKKTIYIYGNHDSQYQCDNRVNLFSVKSTEKHILKIQDQVYTIEHGHRILKGKRSKVIELYSSFLCKIEKSIWSTIVYKFLHILESLGYTLIGTSLMMESKIGRNSNRILKSSNYKGFLICGDTHCPEFDKIKLFANSGTINYGFASYILIIDGEVDLFMESYD